LALPPIEKKSVGAAPRTDSRSKLVFVSLSPGSEKAARYPAVLLRFNAAQEKDVGSRWSHILKSADNERSMSTRCIAALAREHPCIDPPA